MAGCQDPDYSSRSGNGGAAPHQRSYGAIALSSSSLNYGYSTGQASQDEAEIVALDYCKANDGKPADCKVMVWFYDACASLAIKPESPGHKQDGAWGAEWANTQRAAEKKALNTCRKYGGDDCKVVHSYCSR